MSPQSPNYQKVAEAVCKNLKLSIVSYRGAGRYKEVYCVGLNSFLYALKIIIEPSRRTTREIDAIRKCNHPNIARLFDFGTIRHSNRDFDYLLEEYLGEGSLSSLLTRGLIPTAQSSNIGRQLTSALGHLDDLRLVHRDIKPDNIMFKNNFDTPVLVDFGIVRDLSRFSLTDTSAMPGPCTPYFSSPEQLINEKNMINWRSDQFSLGVVLCFSSLGFHPYQHDSEGAFSSDTVMRVRERGTRNRRILGLLEGTEISCVERMTRPWPVERYLKPGDLENAWGS